MTDSRKSKLVLPPFVALIGSDELISPLWRVEQQNDTARYCFEIGRMDGTKHSPRFAHYELRSLVKLLQVLAFAIVDDGWLPDEQQQPIEQLYCQLDAITVRWNHS